MLSRPVQAWSSRAKTSTFKDGCFQNFFLTTFIFGMKSFRCFSSLVCLYITQLSKSIEKMQNSLFPVDEFGSKKRKSEIHTRDVFKEIVHHLLAHTVGYSKLAVFFFFCGKQKDVWCLNV